MAGSHRDLIEFARNDSGGQQGEAIYIDEFSSISQSWCVSLERRVMRPGQTAVVRESAQITKGEFAHMRKVVLMMSISVDGFVKGPHRHAGDFPEPNELKRWKLDRIRRAGAHIMGRVTYEEMAAHWPTSTDDYASPMNDIPKVVFSNMLDEATWPKSSIARGDLSREIEALRRQSGGDIIAWGGACFAQSLSRAGLIDEYVLVILPVAFGGGLPIFRDLPEPLQLEMLEARTFDGSTVLHVYERKR